jgi:phospholipid/cholesterol/gamma-HCH transport system ATP-binding protein
MDPNAVITVDHLFKSFGEKKVLEDFSFSLHKGENVVVLGKSGSGKSVLVKCLIGLIRPESGRIAVLNKEISLLNHRELDELRARVGFLFQSNALYDSMSVRENLEFPLRRHGVNNTKQETDRLVAEALEDVGLGHTAEMQPSELSGGMKKRIALARTLILKPEIILYDEPTTGLDPITSREISNLIRTLSLRYKCSSVIISHDLSCVKITADRIVMLIDGQNYQEGDFNGLCTSRDERVHSFFQ